MSEPAAQDSQTQVVRRWLAPLVGLPEIEREGSPENLAEQSRQAREQGYQAGYQQGLAAAEQEMQLQLQQLLKLGGSLAQPFRRVDSAVEKALVELAVELAKQLALGEIAARDDRLLAIVQQAVAALAENPGPVRLQLPPADALRLQRIIPAEKQRDWQIQAVDSLLPGDIRVLCNDSLVDAGLQQRVALLVAGWFETVD